MRFEKFSFGSIQVDGTTYEHDVVIDLGYVLLPSDDERLHSFNRLK
jgi:hypothetical protein